MRAWEFIREFNEPNKAPTKYPTKYPSIETCGYEQLQEDDEDNIPLYSPADAKYLHRKLKPVGQGAGAIRNYTRGSKSLNSALHNQYRGKKLNWVEKQSINGYTKLDAALNAERLPGPITVYSGLPESPWRAWNLYKADKSAPIRLHLPAYTSATTDISVAASFAAKVNKTKNLSNIKVRNPTLYNAYLSDHTTGDSPNIRGNKIGNVLCITVPEGYPCRSAKAVSEWVHENEILLPRGLDIEVDPHPTFVVASANTDKLNLLVWYAKVIGHNPIEIEDRAK